MLQLVTSPAPAPVRAPCPVGQNYAEASYFDGYAYQHIAEWQEMRRLQGIRARACRMIERRRNPR